MKFSDVPDVPPVKVNKRKYLSELLVLATSYRMSHISWQFLQKKHKSILDRVVRDIKRE